MIFFRMFPAPPCDAEVRCCSIGLVARAETGASFRWLGRRWAATPTSSAGRHPRSPTRFTLGSHTLRHRNAIRAARPLPARFHLHLPAAQPNQPTLPPRAHLTGAAEPTYIRHRGRCDRDPVHHRFQRGLTSTEDFALLTSAFAHGQVVSLTRPRPVRDRSDPRSSEPGERKKDETNPNLTSAPACCAAGGVRMRFGGGGRHDGCCSPDHGCAADHGCATCHRGPGRRSTHYHRCSDHDDRDHPS